jgi:Domain of unknown function (DUF4382)/Carboxypeptidase regulatory-like domain
MSKPKFSLYSSCALLVAAIFFAVMLVTCGGSSPSSSSTAPSTGTVNTSLSDPPSCSASFDHVYVTITKVTANLNADAGPNDSGWQTLVDLTGAPKQIDLLSLANTTCLLTQLGSTTLPTGQYQQIRLYLLSNSPTGNAATPSPNACGSAGYNCVVPSGGTAQPLLLSSEAQTGIKIPSSQITSGGLTVSAGQAVDLNIDFNTCSSLVQQGTGQWRLKPVLHAGEVETNNNALSGTVVDSNTHNPISGAVVSLEQPDPSNSNVDIVTDSTTTDASGNFSFCPLLAGATYDVVVTAMTGGTPPVTYDATITLKVAVGSALGNVPLVAEPLQVGTTTTTQMPANIVGQVSTTANTTTTGATAADATAAVITVSALQDVGGGKAVTIPPFTGSSMTSFATASAPTVNNGTSASNCPTGTDCENYKLIVPASNPSIGTFTAGQTTSYSTPTPAGNPALYWVQAVSVLPSDTTQTDCTPSVIPSSLMSGVAPAGNQIGVDPPPMTDNTVTQDFNSDPSGFVACTSGQ